MSWVERSLDELGYVSRGKSRHRPRDAAILYDGPYPFIQTGDVKHSGLYLSKYTQTYSEAGLAQSKLWPMGTLCITIAANIADTSILAIDACFPDSVIGFIPDTNKTDARFVKYLFDAELKLKYKQFTQGAAQDNLSQAKLLSIRFKIPDDVKEQERIADVISNYDLLIDNNNKRIELLEESLVLLYREWFVRFRFPGHEHSTIINNLPEGWTKTTASHVMDILSGGTPKTGVSEYWGGDIPFFTPKDAGDCAFTYSTEKYISELGLANCNSKLYPKYTIFITARGTVGKLRFAQHPMAMNQSCYALVARPPINQCYLYCALKSSIEELKGKASGSVFDAITVETFSHIQFLVPSETLISEFTNFSSKIFEKIDNLSMSNIKLAEARDLLLPRLMNGDITV